MTAPTTTSGNSIQRCSLPCRGDGGYATVWTAITGFIIIVLAGLIVTAGITFNAQERGYDLAQAAARVGAQELDLTALRTDGTLRLDRARAATRARQFLIQAGATGTATATVTSVTVTAVTHQPTPALSHIGISGITVTATAHATPNTTPTS